MSRPRSEHRQEKEEEEGEKRSARKLLVAVAISAKGKIMEFSGRELRRLAMEETLHDEEEEFVAAAAALDVSVMFGKLVAKEEVVVEETASEERDLDGRVAERCVG